MRARVCAMVLALCCRYVQSLFVSVGVIDKISVRDAS